MLIRILNTLRSRIWDISFFLFSGYLKLYTSGQSLFLRNLNAIQQKDTHFWGAPLFLLHKILISSGAKEQKSRNLI
nr:hypothetical protein [uncultured Anaerobutyricum sp.]